MSEPEPAPTGDPVCWLERVCDACGGLADGPPAPVCERCGALQEAGEAPGTT